MSTLRATLELGAQSVDFGTPVRLDPTGLSLTFEVSPGVDLERAELRIEAPGDGVELAVQPTISTSIGPLDSTKNVDWISADWGTRRALTSIELKSSVNKGRLKVAEGGPWFPPLPFEFIALNQVVRLSGITATRLLLESVNTDKTSVAATFSALNVKVAARPPDFVASLENEAPFFHHPLLLNPGEVLVLRDELTSALRRVLPANLAGGTARVVMRSSAEARLQSVRLSLSGSSLVRTFDGNAERLSAPVAAGDSFTAYVAAPSGTTLQSLAFSVDVVSRPEIVPPLPTPQPSLLVGHLVGGGFRAAQGFSTPNPDAELTGIDVFLQPLARNLVATIDIYPDAFGRPADAPYEKSHAEASVAIEGVPPWAPRWVSFELAAPIPVKSEVFWIVLDIKEGEALWLLYDAQEADPKTEASPRGALFQAQGDRIWREREPPPSYIARIDMPAAHVRPRFRAENARPEPAITVHWGATHVAAPLGPDGRVQLDGRALATLVRPASGDARLKIVVTCPIAATVTLSAVECRTPFSMDLP